ncbi:hypothetical protein [Arvimicrobium flavum]|uniref:hypothetical protein n=1 Tax=Arvimicrobium flavum TaxID=3393320 RepID=UPI00237A81B3|nr:hypothetical protein [Mesorhizobium shangrilense]
MDVANLQLEGLLMAVASVNKVLVQKGVLTVDEIDEALRKAEASMTGDERLNADMSPSNRDAVCFPIRFLQLANLRQPQDQVQSFAQLTRGVGLAKRPYNDQM